MIQSTILLKNLLNLHQNLNFRDCFAYGSLVSATDPVAILSTFKDFAVDGNLYALIFGESILNDAISILLFE
jgi:NhaP-type Na+/H+ or K+/H+ antiporter